MAARTHAETAFLCGCAENEEEVRDLFDLVDGCRPLEEVVDAVLEAARQVSHP
ncbi:hypothetical protein [Lentzea jiangxiensis]|uniref:Uncharacterized protein n=1 Tax=Lentzea jiangxiensis TaxID=641025 RepID=A0A1H0WKD4_9PSEU|nr:hypothetical protein [Lentzea jiangxiensis]SDP91087.1 hypothetical protein SAMN05421507_12018 [Lentzea jiangxiensis]